MPISLLIYWYTGKMINVNGNTLALLHPVPLHVCIVYHSLGTATVTAEQQEGNVLLPGAYNS